MNTANAAALLGVSQSTLKRWVKELDLDMNRNDLGHYDFSEEDLFVLKQIKMQIQNGTFLQDIVVSQNKIRRGKTTNSLKDTTSNQLLKKINELERKVNEKADKVVSYQLLTHRKEIEDLENEVKRLHSRVEMLEKELEEKNENRLQAQMGEKKNVRKKNILTMIFGF